MLLASFLYKRHKSIQPEQLLFLRSAVATMLCVIIVNKNIKYAMYDSIEKKQVKNLTLRCIAAGIINTLELTLVKYLSMVFQGVARNLSPIATIILSALWIGEKFNNIDILFMIVSLLGVIAITIGFSYEKEKEYGNEDSSSFQLGLAVFGSFFIPILTAFTNIITSKMKGMHENTISCYVNPSIGIFSLFIMIVK